MITYLHKTIFYDIYIKQGAFYNYHCYTFQNTLKYMIEKLHAFVCVCSFLINSQHAQCILKWNHNCPSLLQFIPRTLSCI